MALIVEVNKAIEAFKLINSNQESKAAELLGIECNMETGAASEKPCILSRVCEIAKKNLPLHADKGVIVDPSSKSKSSRDIVNVAMDLMYALTESVSLCVANTINTLSILSEEDNEEVRAALLMQSTSDDNAGDTVSGAIINTDGAQKIKSAYIDGLTTSKDALVDLFADTTKLHLMVRDKVAECIGADGKSAYVDLVSNSITGAGILFGLTKMKEFNEDNKDNLDECTNGTDVINRADDIMFATLSLQENMISFYRSYKEFNNHVVKLFETTEPDEELGNSGDPMVDGCAFLTTAIDHCAPDLANLTSNDMIDKYNVAMEVIGALYDEYLQDFCESGGIGDSDASTETPTVATLPADTAPVVTTPTAEEV